MRTEAYIRDALSSIHLLPKDRETQTFVHKIVRVPCHYDDIVPMILCVSLW